MQERICNDPHKLRTSTAINNCSPQIQQTKRNVNAQICADPVELCVCGPGYGLPGKGPLTGPNPLLPSSGGHHTPPHQSYEEAIAHIYSTMLHVSFHAVEYNAG